MVETRDLLNSRPNFSVKFVRRQINMVVYSLARVVTLWSSPQVFDVLRQNYVLINTN